MSFCDYLKEITANCDTCIENGIGACHIKLGSQDYYPKDFAIYDTIQIIRHNGRLSVETDIEVKYKTKFPYGVFAGKGPQFDAEYTETEKAMRDFLEPQLPAGVKLLRSHQHYSPDKFDPEIVAIHIHAHKDAEDLDEAKLITSELVKTMNPKKIEAEIG